ncbi:TLD-domain-containing protein [Cercophora newfieldiana]|uniref:Oxidation resistance protein 1 n=1 Tax=Cercophora newfieldiana TaxID=92897 RepID=A0AA39Y9X1_9PEZI|nr:TLD-domain-containing protein [Cercophora newfieldiana]
MSYSSARNSYRSHSPDYDSPTPSSGAATPPGASSTFLSSSVSSLWGGLVRRFSAETTGPGPNHTPRSYSPDDSFSSHHDKMPGNGFDGVYTPPRRIASPLRPPPLEPLQLNGYSSDTAADARLLTPAIAEEIRIMVPARLSLADEWNLVYSLEQDGASLATLYDKCDVYRGKRVGFVLVVKDCEGGIFGAYMSDLPHPHPKYFGTGECFLWRASVLASLPPPPSEDTSKLTGRTTTLSGAGQPSIRFKAFPYSGVNEYYMLCEAHFFSMGAGDGKYGLWLDDALEKGISSTCQTFGNERLSDEGEKFGVLGVEVWVVGA